MYQMQKYKKEEVHLIKEEELHSYYKPAYNFIFIYEKLSVLAESKETQIGLTLSRNSPGKKLLKRRNKILQNKIYRLQKKKDTDRNKVQTQESIELITFI